MVRQVVAWRNNHGNAGATVEGGWHLGGASPLSKRHGGERLLWWHNSGALPMSWRHIGVRVSRRHHGGALPLS